MSTKGIANEKGGRGCLLDHRDRKWCGGVSKKTRDLFYGMFMTGSSMLNRSSILLNLSRDEKRNIYFRFMFILGSFNFI